MYHKEFSPIAALTPYIRSYFYIRAKSRMFNFPADGCPGLIINTGDPFLLGFKNSKLKVFSGCRLFGYFIHDFCFCDCNHEKIPPDPLF